MNKPLLVNDGILFYNQTSPEDELKQKTAQARLNTYVQGLEGSQKDFVELANKTLRKTYNWNAEQQYQLELLTKKEQTDEFLGRFKETQKGGYDEELDRAAKLAGFERNQEAMYIDSDGNLKKGYMGYFEASDAGNMYAGNFELLTSNAAAIRRKVQMMTSTALLGASKNAKAILPLVAPPQEDQQYITEALRNNNNWSRLLNWDSGSAVLANIPLVDLIYMAAADQTPEEVLLSQKDEDFDGSILVDAMLEDPEHVAFLESQGVNLNSLRNAQNQYHFLFLLNSPVQASAINRTMKTSEEYHWSATNWALFGLDQAKSSLVSGDFVAQVGITVATLGLGTAVAGSATVLNVARTGARLRSAVQASQTAVRLAKIGKGLNRVKDFLPANIPTTLLHKMAPKGIFGIGNAWAKGGSWLTGQVIEGFIEEGITDVFNQVYELSHGTRLKYNYEQTFDAAIMGALMEPVLGGALTVATVPVTVTANLAQKGTSKVAGSLLSYTFNIPSTRFKEMRLYFDSFMGKFDGLSPEDQQVRISMVANALAVESALNEATGNAFGKTEDNINFIGKIMQVLKEDQVLSLSDIASENLSNLSIRLLKLTEELGKEITIEETDEGTVMRLGEVTLPYNEETQQLLTVKNNKVAFTKEGMELVMAGMVADFAGLGSSRESNIVEIVGFMAVEKLQKQIKEENPDLSDEQINDLVEAELEKGEEGRLQPILETMGNQFELIGSLAKTEQTKTADEEVDTSRPDQESVESVVKSKQDIRETVVKSIKPLIPEEKPSKPVAPAATEAAATATAPEAAATAPEAAATAPEAVPEAVPTAPEVVPTAPETKPTEASPTTKEVVTKPKITVEEFGTKAKTLKPELLSLLKNLRKC